MEDDLSHAVILVITDERPDKDELDELMAPYDETTEHPKYTEIVDITDEVEKTFENSEYATLIDCAAEEYGASAGQDGRFYRRQPANPKWDWWGIGGRWTGFLDPTYDPTKDPRNIETCWLCKGTGTRTDMTVANGCNGCDGTGKSVKCHFEPFDGDQMRWGDIPFDALLQKERDRRAATWDAWEEAFNATAATAGESHGTFGLRLSEYQGLVADLRVSRPEDKPLYEVIDEHPRAKFLRDLVGHAHGFGGDIGVYSKAEYIARAVAICPFAVLKDGQWIESGQMGWFGIVSDEKPDWPTQFQAIAETIRPDQWVTVVDFHI